MVKPSRPGVILLEVVVAFTLLAVLLGITLEIVAATNEGSRAVERRAVAGQEAANLMEHVAGLPGEELTPEQLATVELASTVRAMLPQARLAWRVESATDGPPTGKHVSLSIAWKNLAGDDEAPVQLDAWFYEIPRGPAP